MDPGAVPVAAALVVAVAAAVGWQAARHPVPRRFGLRNVVRRPAETALVIGGSLLGGALITGSFIVGDTLDSSIRGLAYQQLGPIDEYVRVPDVAALPRVHRAVAAIDDLRIDGVLSFVTAPAPLSARSGGDVLAEPRGQVIEVDFDDARAFGDDPAATGIDGATPRPGEVALTGHAAATLGAQPGDHVTAHLYGRRVRLEVVSVLPALGVAGFWTGFESVSPNALVAPGTVAPDARKGLPAGAVAPAGIVAVSNRGDVEGGATLTSEVTPLIEHALAGRPLRVERAKQTVLENAEVQGDRFSELFIAIGTFAIVAGILLLVNIFVMLSEERKSQLGMLRAVGLRRSDLVRTFVVEGAVYALVSGALGALLGIGVGWAIVRLAAPIFGGFGDFSLALEFSYAGASVAGGLCLGILISFVTVVATSLRISRINIIRAIRDLPEPRKLMARRRTIVAGGVAGATSLAWFAASVGDESAFVGMIVGLPLGAFCLLPGLARVVRRRAAVLGVSALSLAWGIFGNAATDGGFFEAGDMFAFVIQGVLLVLAAVVLLSQTQETLEKAIRRVAARRLSLRLAIAYPLAHRFRTGLTLGMYALVMFTMVMIAVLAQVFGEQVDAAVRKEAGGYDVRIAATEGDPPAPEEVGAVPGVDRVATLVGGRALFHRDGADAPVAWPVTGIDDSFLAVPPPELEERDERFATDEEVWTAVAEHPRAAIVPAFFLQGGGPPQSVVDVGDDVVMIDPVTGARTTRTVIAIGSSFPAFMSRASVEEALGGRVSPSLFYATTDRDAGETAARLQGRFIANGVRADTFRAIVEDMQRGNLQFMRLMQSYLALGLLVGIAGLGVVMIRAVRERRREIGVLRSLGFLPRHVRRAFTLESGFTALEGILIGAALALVTASQLVANGEFGQGLRFSVPWDEVAVLCAAALAASLAATAWPAQQASRVPPAVALRVAE